MNHATNHLGFSVSACAVVMAAALGGSSAATPAEARAVEAIESNCTASWRNARIAPQDWADCTQEAFAELLDRISRDRMVRAIDDAESRERLELKRSIWCTVQRWRRSPKHQPLNGNDVAGESGTSNEDLQTLDEIRQLVQHPRTGLTSRQRKIVLQWLDGDSVAEIADALNLPAARVSDEKYKGLRKLRGVLG